jgi:hypothetical protein
MKSVAALVSATNSKRGSGEVLVDTTLLGGDRPAVGNSDAATAAVHVGVASKGAWIASVPLRFLTASSGSQR